MMRFLLLLLPVSVPLLAEASAQSPATPDLERIERPWPTTPSGNYGFAGADTGLACGAFLSGHDSRSAVILRGGELYLSFAPAQFQHFTGVGQLTAPDTYTAIGTLPAIGGGPDHLATVSPAGLQVLHYDGSLGFVPATTQAGLTGWAAIEELRIAAFSPAGVTSNFVLGFAADGARVASVDPAGTMTSLAHLPAPAGIDVLDATLIDWNLDGVPEVVSVLETGAFVLTLAGDILATISANTDAASIVRLRGGVAPSVCMVVHAAPVWDVFTWSGPGVGTLSSGGSLALPADVTGISTFDLEGDADPEVVISTTDSVRYLLSGSANGPQANAATRIEIGDVRPETLPANPAPNLAPLVVDDIDLDGTLDFVIPQTATDQLVLMLAVRPQVQWLVYTNEDDGDAVPSIELTSVLGLDVTPGSWALPQPATTDGLGLRLAIPATVDPQMAVQVLIYEIPPEPAEPPQTPEPSGSDAASPQVAARYRYQLPADVAGNDMDIMVPVVDYDTFAAGSIATERYLLEINLSSGDHGTSPILLEYWIVQNELDATELDELMNPTAYAIWDFQAGNGVFERIPWVAGQTMIYASTPVPPEDPLTPGNRYIGLIVPVKSKPVSSNPPQVPTSQALGNGVKVQ